MGNLVKNIFSWFLIVSLIMQPTLSYAQDNIKVVGIDDGPRPRVDESYNGTTVINIDTPNSAGVSHDVFSVFEADDVILNNSATNVDTEIGGWIEGNPNLSPNVSADLWIGEVVGGNQTVLNGILEVGGDSMDVILANENGITCNGCGFINTNRATLTTGTPQYDSSGRVTGFDVRQGIFTVGPNGLNPESRVEIASTGRVDVIARAAVVYGKMRAKTLNVITGANKVDYNWSYDPETGQVTGITEQEGNGSAPALAVDVAVLGGMYANAIHLVATERGVGVNIDGEMASSSNIALRSNGKLTLGAPSASHLPKIKSKKKVYIRSEGPLLLEGAITSEDNDLIDIKTSGDSMIMSGEVSGGTVLLESAGLANISAAISAQEELNIKADSLEVETPAELEAAEINMVSVGAGVLDGKFEASGTLQASIGGSLSIGSDGQLSATNITLQGAELENEGVIVASESLSGNSVSGNWTNSGEIEGAKTNLESGAAFTNSGTISGNEVEISATTNFSSDGNIVSDDHLNIESYFALNQGKLHSENTLKLDTNAGGFLNQGTITGEQIIATSAGDIGNAGTISAGQLLTLETSKRISNVASLISGNDLNLFANEILNNGGVVWANDTINIAANAEMENASILQNSTGKIEALQGDLVIRADEVHNLGVTPTLAGSEIIKWTESGNAEPIVPSEEMHKLIDESYLDANGNILQEYAAAYTALWMDLISGADTLSDEAKTILKSAVFSPSGTALNDDFKSLWSNMYARSNEEGVTDPANFVFSMLADNVLDVDGNILPEYQQSYADLWYSLASGASDVSDEVAAILKPETLQLDEAGAPTNLIGVEYTDLWSAMAAGSSAPYDIVYILYQDQLNDDGKVAELIAGNDVDIQTDKLANIYGNIHAGNNINVVAETIENKALGATQILVEVHKKPGCFVCHEGEVDYYDTFGGQINAGADVNISGNLTNETVPTSGEDPEHLIEILNAYLEEKRAEGDADLAGVPNMTHKNLELHDNRFDDYTAPKEDVELEEREPFTLVEYDGPLGPQAPAPLTPDLTPTKSVDELLAAGLNTISETNPEFTEYSNFITSNYMMEVDRLQYRDDLLNNTETHGLAEKRSSTSRPELKQPIFPDKPVQIPALDGSGMVTIYPSNPDMKLNPDGALIGGANVTIDGDEINNDGVIVASNNTTINATNITSTGGKIKADGGKLAMTAVARIDFEDTELDAYDINIIAGQDFVGKGVAIKAETAASIYATTGATLTSLETQYQFDWSNGTVDTIHNKLSTLDVGGDLSIMSFGDLELAGVQGDIGGKLNLTSYSGNILLSAVTDQHEAHMGDNKNGEDWYVANSMVTDLTVGDDFIANAGGSATLVGTKIDSGGSVQLAGADGVVLAASQDIYTYDQRKTKKKWYKKKTSSHSLTSITNEGVSIAAASDINVIAEGGDLITAGSSFESNTGNINLKSVEGDILAGTYVDVFSEKKEKSTSYLGGLINSSSSSNKLDRTNTGTQALAALDLALVSGEDTELVGAKLSAGGKLSVETGGDFSVQAAIDSQQYQFFSQNMGAVLMTTITESSFTETAVMTEFMSGLGLSFDIGGDTFASLYGYSGVDAPNPEDLYPEELLAIEGLQLLSQQLADEYFYDKQQQLSPAFKALLSVAIGAFVTPAIMGAVLPASITGASAGTFLSAVGTGIEAFTTNFIVGSIDGAVSGDLDLGEIIGDAAFSGLSAGLTAGINLDDLGITPETNPALFEGLLGEFGNGSLTIAGILEGTLDGAISSGLSSAVYGTDFGSGFSSSLINTVVNLTLADVQFEIGELGKGIPNWEGSPTHALLHGLAGCVAAVAQGGNCAAGAAGGVAQSLYAGAVTGSAPERGDYANEAEWQNAYGDWQEQQTKLVSVLGAVAGYIFSGGDAANVDIASSVAGSGFENNYLTHEQMEEVEELLALIAAECRGHIGPPACASTKPKVAAAEAKLKYLKQQSAAQTLEMIHTCTEAPQSGACKAMLEEARAFVEWSNEASSFGSFATGGDAMLPGSWASWMNLDTHAVEVLTQMENGTLSAESGAQELLHRVAAFDGTIQIINGVVEVAGVTVCTISTGGACAVAVLAGLVGANKIYEGSAQIITGKNEISAIEEGMVYLGMDKGSAAAVLDAIETGVAVVTLVNGVYMVRYGVKTWAIPKAPNRPLTQYPDGTFSVSDWTGYPTGVPRPPEGATYRLLSGSEYTEARRLANNANAQLRRSGVVPDGHEIHEIVPVKYGGSPTDPANKVYLPRGVHRSEVTPWWNRLQRDLE